MILVEANQLAIAVSLAQRLLLPIIFGEFKPLAECRRTVAFVIDVEADFSGTI